MDGVIVDSEPLHIEHLHKFLLTIGVPEPQKFTGNLKGVSATDTWRLLIQEFDLPQDVDVLVKNSRQSYIDYLNELPNLPSIPGSVDFIKYIHDKGYKLALASSAAPARIQMFLKKLKLEKYFQTVVSGDDVDHSKPDPDIFLLAAERLGVKPRDCVVVEDATNGVQAASRAGMKCIAYAGSIHNDDDLSSADLIVKDFGALTKALKTGALPV